MEIDHVPKVVKEGGAVGRGGRLDLRLHRVGHGLLGLRAVDPARVADAMEDELAKRSLSASPLRVCVGRWPAGERGSEGW